MQPVPQHRGPINSKEAQEHTSPFGDKKQVNIYMQDPFEENSEKPK